MEPNSDDATSPFLKGIGHDRLDECREVKVKLPVGHLIRLHGIKIVDGRGISESITEALSHYFDALEHDIREGHVLPPETT